MTNPQNEKEYTVNSISYKELRELEEEYKKEETGQIPERHSIFRGMGIGASLGLVSCLLLNFGGSSLSVAEIICLIGGLTILGTLTGYATS